MNIYTQDQFTELLDRANIKPRLRRDVRFTASTVGMNDDDWFETELLAVTDRNGNKGVLLLGLDGHTYVAAYELSKGLVSHTGRTQPIICDFCRTWQAGSGAGSISFMKDRQSINSVGFLCCADLQCAQHVRGLTSVARVSRAQLREDMTTEQRLKRFKNQLRHLVADLQLQAF